MSRSAGVTGGLLVVAGSILLVGARTQTLYVYGIVLSIVGGLIALAILIPGFVKKVIDFRDKVVEEVKRQNS